MQRVLRASLYGVVIATIAMVTIAPGAMADPVLDRAVESAATAEDHAALAARYREMATEQAELARKHRARAEMYRKRGRMGVVQAPLNHCKALAKLAESTRTEYEALAQAHEEASQE